MDRVRMKSCTNHSGLQSKLWGCTVGEKKCTEILWTSKKNAGDESG